MEHNEISRRGVVAGAAAMGALAAEGTGVATSASAANPVLKAGSRGSSVTALQKRLNSLGYWCGTPDGVFGALTVQAVLAIQKVAGLGRDGVVGDQHRGGAGRVQRGGDVAAARDPLHPGVAGVAAGEPVVLAHRLAVGGQH